ncbi:hypothetical protein PNH50_06370 [Leisingera aquaemixtae]|uniref:hypothetical protein n=1 Tax=Leisingera aquaemixtae TaxID=1396826 RepID=UPI0039844149
MFQYPHPLSGAGFMHSANLDDMRAALLDEDEKEDDDGPDGGSPFIAGQRTQAALTVGSQTRRA